MHTAAYALYIQGGSIFGVKKHIKSEISWTNFSMNADMDKLRTTSFRKTSATFFFRNHLNDVLSDNPPRLFFHDADVKL